VNVIIKELLAYRSTVTTALNASAYYAINRRVGQGGLSLCRCIKLYVLLLRLKNFWNTFILRRTSQRFCVEYSENTCLLISYTLRVVINITENRHFVDLFKYENCPNNAGNIYVDSSSNVYRYIYKLFLFFVWGYVNQNEKGDDFIKFLPWIYNFFYTC
jgi:hypothetical protein